jgi:hypothetical protein
MTPDLDRPRCHHCRRPMRVDARKQLCRRCQRLKEPCPSCGRPKLLTSERCRHCHGRFDPYGFRHRHFNGRCRGRRWRDGSGTTRLSFGPVDGCQVTWGNLDHVHCACGRPMAGAFLRCGRCVAQDLASEHDGYCSRCGLESVAPYCRFCVEEVAESLLSVLADAPDVSELELPEPDESPLRVAATGA